MHKIVLVPLLSISLWGSILDFKYLNEAKEAYQNREYQKANELYGKIKSDEAKFNQADALYRAKKYKEAIEQYRSIKEPNLKAKALHNIGNSYAKMNKIDEAIKAYEEALKLNNDKDTKFNLELLKKKKKEQEKKQQQKSKDNKKDKDKRDKKQQKSQNNQKKRDSKDKKQQKNSSNENNQTKKSQEQENRKKEQKKRKEQERKEKQEQKKAQEQKRQQAKMAEQNRTQPPISNMEERKWQKMLNKRGVNTLMIPLNSKGAKQHETNPW